MATLTAKAEAIRHLRLSHAMTQRDLARAAGLARVTVARLENGGPCSPYSVKRLATALDVAVCDIAEVIHA